jgi:hypothetical protein
LLTAAANKGVVAPMPLDTDGQWTNGTGATGSSSTFTIANPTVNDGHGQSFTDTRGLFVLHAVLLHTGKVLIFCGHVELSMYAPLCYEFDPATPTASLPAQSFPPGADLFCCHYVNLHDGRVLAVGGSETHGLLATEFNVHGSSGSKTIALYDPLATGMKWSVSAQSNGTANELGQGRWYPTLVTLPDGRVAVFSGRRETGSGVSYPPIADKVEIISQTSTSNLDWSAQDLTGSGSTKALPIYPGLHLAPNGRIYYTHTNWGQEMADPTTTSLLIPAAATAASWTDYAGSMPPHPRREEGMSVLLPPAQDGRILIIGGSKAVDSLDRGVLDRTGRAPGATIGPTIFDHIAGPTAPPEDTDPRQADVMNTSAASGVPTWSSVGPMAFGRINGHCVLLPDATVLICGGHDRYKWESTGQGTTPSLTAEIFTPGATPGTGTFRSVAAMVDPRMYHSIAILLPDGRVLAAGGANANLSEPTITYPTTPSAWVGRRYGPGMARNMKTFEFYEPPYMHKGGTRPVIDDVQRNGASTGRIDYGQTFTILTAQAADIDKVSFMRPGACTHHTDSEQRYVRLEFTRGTNELTVTAVSDPNVAPPGYYMLWIVDTTGRVCREAKFIHLLPSVGTPGTGTRPPRSSTCLIATATLGSPDHPGVLYLQNLRQELYEGSRLARTFINAVNRVYYSFSPSVARRLENDPTAREAVRQTIVQPVLEIVRVTDRLSTVSTRGGREAALILLFTLEAVLGVMLLPLLLLVVVGKTLVSRKEAD